MIEPSLTSLDHARILRALRIPPEEHSSVKAPAEFSDGAGLLYDELDHKIRACEKKVLESSYPRVIYRIFPSPEILSAFPGNDIRRLLQNCGEAVLMALTLGTTLEKALMLEEVRDMSAAYIMDVCASLAVEEAADDFERKLRAAFISKGLYLTNRFSPGYGDLPLHVQRSLLELLNAGRTIGLTLTPTDLMVPRKSITAVLGICDIPKERITGGCGHCPIQTKCSWRSQGSFCYESSIHR